MTDELTNACRKPIGTKIRYFSIHATCFLSFRHHSVRSFLAFIAGLNLGFCLLNCCSLHSTDIFSPTRFTPQRYWYPPGPPNLKIKRFVVTWFICLRKTFSYLLLSGFLQLNPFFEIIRFNVIQSHRLLFFLFILVLVAFSRVWKCGWGDRRLSMLHGNPSFILVRMWRGRARGNRWASKNNLRITVTVQHPLCWVPYFDHLRHEPDPKTLESRRLFFRPRCYISIKKGTRHIFSFLRNQPTHPARGSCPDQTPLFLLLPRGALGGLKQGCLWCAPILHYYVRGKREGRRKGKKSYGSIVCIALN